ncbi:autorepressor SdpR family transcription factor [Fodinibius halophilus]|uniref:Winged helix-turn-helix transcriptional regulator n=1 Tax=Fodinibius halophilus TaxID=1736908 RepID=A0A6M1T6T2_9BACT|nr:autorepressor SdpR family transcription factor [Fodinibius halophilus]NGP89819.1 winged helix-turn-helix transcriptional regulator [Fodinibius halophilus]
MNTLFKALNDATRRRILQMLQDKDMTAGEIADQFDISKPSISHHLDILKQAKLISSERDGQFIRYAINTTVVEEAANWFLEILNKSDSS